MAYGLTNAKGASGAQAELIWSGSASDVTIDYGNYSQLIVCNRYGRTLIDVPTTDAVNFAIGKRNDNSSGHVCFGIANAKGSVSLTSTGYVSFLAGSAQSIKEGVLTEIYGIKDALV